MMDLDNPTVCPVHLQLFRPSVIRGPWLITPYTLGIGSTLFSEEVIHQSIIEEIKVKIF